MAKLMSDAVFLTNIEEELRMFLANMEVYGSMPLLDSNASDANEMFITDYTTQCRYLSLHQLSDTIKKLNNIAQNGQVEGGYHTNPLLAKVLRVDVPELVGIMERIQKVFKIK